MDLRSERWGQIVDEALFPFRITTDNLTPATPPPARTLKLEKLGWRPRSASAGG
jgi:hypothetical protein